MTEHRFDNLDVDEALRVIAEGTATTIGKSFYASLVESLSGTLDTTGAWVTEYLRDTQRLRALAFWLNGEWIEDYEYDIEVAGSVRASHCKCKNFCSHRE